MSSETRRIESEQTERRAENEPRMRELTAGRVNDCRRSGDRVRTSLPKLVVAAAVLTLAAGFATPQARADHPVDPPLEQLSDGCQHLNPSRDPTGTLRYWSYSGGFGFAEPIAFAAGERVVITALDPATLPPDHAWFDGRPHDQGWIPPDPLEGPWEIWLRVAGPEGVVMLTAPYPGTIEYLFPTSGMYDFYVGNANPVSERQWPNGPYFYSGRGTLWSSLCAQDPPSGAAELLDDLRSLVETLDLHRGISTALVSKLDASRGRLAAGNTRDACGSLSAFANQVRAHAGKRLTALEAQQLAAAATRIATVLVC